MASKAEIVPVPALSYRVLEMITLNPEQIEMDESRNGRFAPPKSEQIARMAKSLRENGQKSPIQVLQQIPETGLYPLYIGFTRTKAALKAGLSLRAEVVEIGEQDRLFGNAVENMDRNDLGTMDHARNVKRFLDAGLSNKDIVARLGKSAGWVSKMGVIASLPAKYHRDVQSGVISMEEAYRLLRPERKRPKAASKHVAARRSHDALMRFRADCDERSKPVEGQPASAVNRFFLDLGQLIDGKLKFEELTKKWTVRLRS